MERFVGEDFDSIKPFVGLAAATGLAEITTREPGVKMSGKMRRNIKQLPNDALSESSRTGVQECLMAMRERQGRPLVEALNQRLPAGPSWQPVAGKETLALIKSQTNLSSQEKVRLLKESHSILAQCVSPTEEHGQRCGLAVGSIQSGKTLSFTTVAAMARDNGFQIVIVLTGTVNILNIQSRRRVSNLLRMNSRSDFAWRLLRNPKPAQAQDIEGILQDWRVPHESGLQPQTLFITVLKNKTHLNNLVALLSGLNLAGVPTLIIDDEADQAGLNTAVRRGSKSPTYRELSGLREALPHHTYLGYTATPQAPLLISAVDHLSPEFVQLLTPGDDYTGGTQFFEHEPSLIRTIPSDQIPSKKNRMTEPPQSLLNAMRVFLAGVAAGIVADDSVQGGPRNRSMLVHPSALTAQHDAYFQWVQSLKSSWGRLLDSDEEADRMDREALVEDFRRTYDDLARTVADIPSFDQILAVLAQAVRRTAVYEINGRLPKTSLGIDDIDEFWRSNYSFILVGGQSLERGFTVEGLTVTYMPRGKGVGQADSIQQRARFYGYNREHLGYCRVYLESAARDAYHAYIGHEEQLKRSLAEHVDTGRPFNEWLRAFFLDPSLKPTRAAVLSNDYTRGPKPKVPHEAMPPLNSQEYLDQNRRLIGEFADSLAFVPDDGDPRRTAGQTHQVSRGVSAQTAYEQLIVPLRIDDSADWWNYLQIRLQIASYLDDHPDAVCTVYRMRPGATEFGRTLNGAGKIVPYQGADSRTGYRGDRTIFDPDRLTIQIYQHSRVLDQEGNVLATEVPQIAIVLPPEIAVGMVAQRRDE